MGRYKRCSCSSEIRKRGSTKKLGISFPDVRFCIEHHDNLLRHLSCSVNAHTWGQRAKVTYNGQGYFCDTYQAVHYPASLIPHIASTHGSHWERTHSGQCDPSGARWKGKMESLTEDGILQIFVRNGYLAMSCNLVQYCIEVVSVEMLSNTTQSVTLPSKEASCQLKTKVPCNAQDSCEGELSWKRRALAHVRRRHVITVVKRSQASERGSL